MQELGLSIWMNDVTPCLRHVKLGKDFTSSKITRPAMWITQEVVRKLAFHSFHNAAQCSVAWKEFENNPTANHWLNWATSRYDDSLLKFAIGARLYTLRTPAVNRRDYPETADIPCPMCGLVITRSRAVIASAPPMSGSKAASSQRDPAEIPTMGQQVPNYPIVPYSGDGSRAGSFRPGGGLGSTDTCVAQGHPSKT
jgi:hypothetical protein